MGCQLTDNEPTPGPKRPLHPDVMIERRRVLHILDRAIQAAAEGELVTIAMLIEVKNRIED